MQFMMRLAPWLMLKLMFYVIVGLGRKLGLIPPARPSGETSKPPFDHLLWAVGKMGQHLIQGALESE